MRYVWGLFTPSGVQSVSERTQFAFDLTSDLGSEDPFSLQIDA